MQNEKEFCLEVWGDMACFTRPEFKVERVSYDIMTPSAARNIFQSVFWKPAIEWQVTSIEVLNPIQWTNIKTNETNWTASLRKGSVNTEDVRHQRNTHCLKDVRYRIRAIMTFVPPEKRTRPEEQQRKDETPEKYFSMFERRAGNGQCFMRPYLGLRQFPCFFRLIRSGEEPVPPIRETRDLGVMFYDYDYSRPKPEPMFFRAQMNDGTVTVPPCNGKEVLR